MKKLNFRAPGFGEKITCPSCGKKIPASSKTCPKCGHHIIGVVY